MNSNPPRARGRPKAWGDKSEQNTIKSLDRALVVLGELARLESATLSGLAGSLKESPATVYRILTTFQSHGMVELDEHAQTWHIGPGAFRIGSVFLRRTSLIERARPALRQLMEQTGETANLGVESDGAVLFVSQVETHASIRAFFPPGTRSPIHSSGIGKALLAGMSDARIAQIIARGLEQFTPHTLSEPQALVDDIKAIRARGYSIDNEERNEGMRCIAAPIRNALGEVVAGVSVSGPTSRLRMEHVEDIGALVLQTAQMLSDGLGARETGPAMDM